MINQFTDGNKFLDNFLKNKSYIYLTSITKEYVTMTHNWFESLKNINSENLALVISLDNESYINLRKLNIPTVLLDLKITNNESKQDWIENEKNVKCIAANYIGSKYKIDIIHCDVDIIFLKDPFIKIQEFVDQDDDIDMIFMSDRRFDKFINKRKINVQTIVINGNKEVQYCGPTAQQLYGEEDGGFVYVRFSKKSKLLNDFLSVFYEKSSFYEKFPKNVEAGNLQTIFNARCKEFKLNVKKFNCFEFVNGSIWKIPYLKNKIKDNFYIVHYNFVEPFDLAPIPLRDKKIQLMKDNNHWYI